VDKLTLNHERRRILPRGLWAGAALVCCSQLANCRWLVFNGAGVGVPKQWIAYGASMSDQNDDNDNSGIAQSRLPTATDRTIGQRIRDRREATGLSIDELSKFLGLSNTQVQKYETGVNRVGASRLNEIARILDVPLMWFFEGLATAVSAQSSNNIPSINPFSDIHFADDLVDLLSQFSMLRDRRSRRHAIDLVTQLKDAQYAVASG
jgi:transcriptional regulator with XRE-family HTH domain